MEKAENIPSAAQPPTTKNLIKYKMKKALLYIPQMYTTYKNMMKINDNRGMLEITVAIFKFLKETQQSSNPRVTQICSVRMDTDEKVFDVVSLWAAVGNENNPIKRSTELRTQRDELAHIISDLIRSDFEVSDSLKKRISIAMNHIN